MTDEPKDLPLAEILAINAAATIAVERYQEDGHADRYGYLKSLAEQHELTIAQVLFASDINGGAEEDFDGLILTIEDHRDQLAECE